VKRRASAQESWAARCIVAFVALVAASCSPEAGPQTGTQTNWLTLCATDADCGDLRCLCGACTQTCDEDSTCDDVRNTSCVPPSDPGAVAMCGGAAPPADLCLPRCPSEGCGPDASCVAGVCTAAPEPAVVVSIDDASRFQSLVGIGASVAYVNDAIVRHPLKDELFDTMFSGSGLGVVRLRNRFVEGGDDDLASTREIIEAARERLPSPPLLFMNSASPPNALKANGSSWCEGNPETCTLVKLPDGTFDYAGLARHWRGSVEAYAAAGLDLDYVSIQNNPNWVPPAGTSLEACRFLPTEGSATVTTDAGDVDVDYPGYAEALAAIRSELDALDQAPQIVAPETTTSVEAAEYVEALDTADFDAIAYHMYGPDPTNVDVASLEALRDLAVESDRPLFQSEMASDALDTATLMHTALAVGGSSMFVHNEFVGPESDIESSSERLIVLTEDDFRIGDLYHVMLHYAAHVGAGWVRVAADSSSESLYASAWTSPNDDTLVVVLTNPGLASQAVRVDLGEELPTGAEATRTALGGSERSAELGQVSPHGVVTLPAHSIATITVPR